MKPTRIPAKRCRMDIPGPVKDTILQYFAYECLLPTSDWWVILTDKIPPAKEIVVAKLVVLMVVKVTTGARWYGPGDYWKYSNLACFHVEECIIIWKSGWSPSMWYERLVTMWYVLITKHLSKCNLWLMTFYLFLFIVSYSAARVYSDEAVAYASCPIW